ncbi:tRNA dimethylallyltransferase [Propionispora sp. 2/2-37]|uniref:tRNA (adenosine(37)-N6)-dimethylallyltransferase MiaA n=1 Tax=Propionispora sp. 2/2-37 TaxID=1677858 RepID=UPI0006BB68C5|nr:tRNA (adenosine(37)-N6)-dimethylallyltransferase MiaA [Propionispora sp. 2/2-37]CUH94183.1 tRNA dimethylallyltransferase [Propionispora sp. 2/2-37]
MERVIAVIGPTAVGKTKVSIDLARKLNTEIISGDSMLVYQQMNIGTAKPDMAERRGVTHHLVDCLKPTEQFSVADFQQLAAQHITAINQQGKVPVLVGGTGLYVRALLEDYQFNSTAGSEKLRLKLENLADLYGNTYLHNKLAVKDPDTAARLHPNDRRRIIRALEVNELGGERISQAKNPQGLVYNAAVIALTLDRAALYRNINLRVDQMVTSGLVAEVDGLLKQGVSPECQAMKGIGYKEIVAYLQGDTDLAQAVENIKQATRNFAKRQLTWYRKMPYIQWFKVDEYIDYANLMESIYRYVAGKLGLK